MKLTSSASLDGRRLQLISGYPDYRRARLVDCVTETAWLGLLALAVAAPPASTKTETLKAVLHVVPDRTLVWIGVQNKSAAAGVVCVEEGSLEVVSRGGTTGGDLVSRSDHGTQCDGAEGWHLLQPGERYYFVAAYSQADESASEMKVALKVRFGSVGAFVQDGAPHYIKGSAGLAPLPSGRTRK
jgi:hypothetical protein